MNITVIEPHKSSLGLDANLVGAIIFGGTLLLSFIPFLGWIAWGVPLAFFFIEKDSRFVKFQAVTCLVIAVIGAVISIVLRIIMAVIMPRSYDLYDIYRLATRAYSAYNAFRVVSAISTIFVIIFVAIYAIMGVMAFLYKQVELPLIGTIAAKAGAKMEGLVGGEEKGKTASGKKKTTTKAKGSFCPSCGKSNEPGAKFCPSCGAKLG